MTQPVALIYSTTARSSVWRAFTLIELLVSVGIMAVLMATLLPALSSAKDSARKVACLSNLRQIGVAIHCYANDNRGQIPFGPKAPPMMTATNFYPSTGAPTSLISLSNGDPVGLGLMLRKHVAKEPKVLFCPGGDQPSDAQAELAKVGHQQAQCSYYYRHASVDRMYDDPTTVSQPPEHIMLANLGRNRNARPIRALAVDTQFPAPAGFATFGIFPRTHHRQRWANILAADSHAVSRSNADGRFNVNLDDYEALRNAFDRILRVLEIADTQ